ncbi:MAG: ThuA domain-containing protein [Akkermansiaceae bacterium]|nr:ThuA domain-containing protein [Akkermansiaceae bacterium]
MFKKPAIALALGLGLSLSLHAAPAHRLLFFSKSSGFEHDVISWKKGQPSFAEKIFTELGAKHSWEFVFSKDGSKFSPEYLAGFDAVIFYTSGNLLTTGTDKQPAMTPAGKQALFDYIKGGKGFIGLHCASDTFHTTGTPDRRLDATKDEDAYICTVGGEFITHGAQQVATNKVIDPKFPGFETAGDQFTFLEEWYALKNFNPDLHALTVIKTEGMDGAPYQRSDYPTTWARAEGKGRVYYSALGHREDVWTNPTFQNILVGAIRWTTGDVDAVIPPNLKTAAPDVVTNPLAEAARK